MITDPKLIRTIGGDMLSLCFDGRRRRIRTADPLGVNDTTRSNFNGLTFVLPSNLSRTYSEQTAQSVPFLSRAVRPSPLSSPRGME